MTATAGMAYAGVGRDMPQTLAMAGSMLHGQQSGHGQFVHSATNGGNDDGILDACLTPHTAFSAPVACTAGLL